MLSQLHQEPISIAGFMSDGQAIHRGYRRVIRGNVQHKWTCAAKYKVLAEPHALLFEAPSLQQWRSHHDGSAQCRRAKTSAVATCPKGPRMFESHFSWKDWLVPPVLFPASLVALIVIYALVRGPA